MLALVAILVQAMHAQGLTATTTNAATTAAVAASASTAGYAAATTTMAVVAPGSEGESISSVFLGLVFFFSLCFLVICSVMILTVTILICILVVVLICLASPAIIITRYLVLGKHTEVVVPSVEDVTDVETPDAGEKRAGKTVVDPAEASDD